MSQVTANVSWTLSQVCIVLAIDSKIIPQSSMTTDIKNYIFSNLLIMLVVYTQTICVTGNMAEFTNHSREEKSYLESFLIKGRLASENRSSWKSTSFYLKERHVELTNSPMYTFHGTLCTQILIKHSCYIVIWHFFEKFLDVAMQTSSYKFFLFSEI